MYKNLLEVKETRMIRNNLLCIRRNQDPAMIAKGLFLSLLTVSSTISFFFMVPEATPALTEPSVTDTITGLSDARDVAYDPAHGKMYVTGVISLSANVMIPS